MARALHGTCLERAPQRRKALDFIQAEVAAGRPFPGTAAIRDFMGWKRESSVRDVLHTLAAFDHVLIRTWDGDGWIFTLGTAPAVQADAQREVF